MYDIEISYRTGDSFGSRNEIECVGIVVDNLEDAKENLRRIEKHYRQHEESPDFDRDYELILLSKDGERTIIPFWIGYFEQLHGAKIVQPEDPGMSFTV